MSLRKWIALLMAVMLVLLSAGCGATKDSSTSTGQQTAQQPTTSQEKTGEDKKEEGPEPLTLPIVSSPLELSLWVPLNNNAAAVVKDYGEIEAMKVIREKTGIDIKWLHPPVGQQVDQFNLMISTKDLPDMIEYTWTNYTGGPDKAIQDGILIPLNDLIDKYAPNFKKLLEQYPDIKKQIATDNGTIYCFPYIYTELEMEGPFMGLQVRKDWLDDLKLDIPTTIDEWYAVLKAFRENDPNKNGEKDEIPFGSVENKAVGMGPELRWFLTAWGMTPQYYGWYKVGDEVKFAYMEPNYYEFLKTMAKWYKEGLIDPDYTITDATAFDSKVTTNKIGAYFGYPASRLARYQTLMEKENPNVKLAGAPYPTLTKGSKPVIGHKNNNVQSIGIGITTKCKNVVEAVKWIDFRYSQEGHMLLTYGIEGKSYTMVNGLPVFTDEILKNPDGLSPTQALAKYSMGSWGTTRYHAWQAEKQLQSRPEQVDALNIWRVETKERNLPPLTLTADEGTIFANIMNEVHTFVSQTETELIMGIKPIETFDYEAYVETLKKMNIEEAIKIQQAALDRYNKR